MNKHNTTSFHSVITTIKELKKLEDQKAQKSKFITPQLSSPFIRALPEEADLVEIRDGYLHPCQDLIEEASRAIKELSKKAHVAAKLKAFEEYLKGDSSIKGEELVADLLNSDEFARVRELAETKSSSLGVSGIGLGISGSLALIIGIEAGFEGIVTFPKKVGNTTEPAQGAYRAWIYEGIGVDLGLSTGLVFSIWFSQPTSSKYLVGAFISVVIGVGVRVDVVGVLPISQEAQESLSMSPKNIIKKLVKYTSGIGIGIPQIGLNALLGVFTGQQEMNLVSTLATFTVVNPATNQASIIAGAISQLDMTLTCPTVGDRPGIVFTNQTIITITIPAYLSKSTDSMVITPPEDFKLTSTPGLILTFAYTGADKTPWTEDLKFTISNVKSNSGEVVPQDGQVVLLFSNIEFVIKILEENDITTNGRKRSLQLIAESYKATFDWKIVTKGDFVVDGASEGTCTAYSNPDSSSNFTQLADDDNTPVTVTDDQQIKWLMGYDFSSDGLIQAFWQRDGKPYIPRYQYPGDKINEKGEESVAKYNYQSDNTLTITLKEISKVTA